MESNQLKWLLKSLKLKTGLFIKPWVKLEKWAEWSLGLWVFSIPFQSHVWLHSFQANSGLSTPFSSLFLTAPELVLLLSTLLWWKQSSHIQAKHSFEEKKSKYTGLTKTIWTLVAALILFHGIEVGREKNWIESLWFGWSLFKLLELAWIFHLITFTKQTLHQWKHWLSAASLIQIFIAITQWKTGHSLGLNLLGEPTLNPEILGLARFEGETRTLRAYGTFSHPNILAAWLVWSSLIHLELAQFKLKNLTWINRCTLVLSLIGIALTGSRIAWLAYAIGLGAGARKNRELFHKKWWVSGLAFLLIALLTTLLLRSGNLDQWAQRTLSWSLGLQLLLENLWTGTGWMQGTLHLEEISPYSLEPWELQMPHNLILSFAMEWGLPLTILIAMKILQKNTLRNITPALLGLLIFGLHDHFLYSLDVGRQLMILAIASSSLQLSAPNDHLASTPDHEETPQQTF